MRLIEAFDSKNDVSFHLFSYLIDRSKTPQPSITEQYDID